MPLASALAIPGDRYIVVDSGGGTVDMTVHQIRLPEGHLKELYKATGNATSTACFMYLDGVLYIYVMFWLVSEGSVCLYCILLAVLPEMRPALRISITQLLVGRITHL